MSNGKPLLPQWAYLAVIGAVVFMWVVCLGYSIVNPKWTGMPPVHGIAGAVVTFVLGGAAVARKMNGG